jgi:hypothetical protein
MKFLLVGLLLITHIICNAGIAVVNGLSHLHYSSDALLGGSIKIRNEGDKPESVILYLQDFYPHCEGSIEYKSAGLSPWISLEKDRVLLQPGAEVEVKYSFGEVSAIAASKWQVIMVESEDPISSAVTNGVNVLSKVRYAVQVVMHIGTYLPPPITFEEVRLPDKQSMTVKVKNSGDFMSQVKLKIEILTEDGQVIKTLEGGSRRLYPGYCTTFTLTLEGIPSGKYAGVLVADNGKDLFGSNLILTL